MTREEAIAIIRKEYLCVDRDCDIEKSCGKCDLMMPSKEPILQAYKMAIKALEQEPCEDVISRQAVLDKKELVELEDGQSFYCISPEDVETLSPVTPQPKWIPVSERLPYPWDEKYLVSLAWGGIGIMEYKSTGFHNYGSFTPVPIESIIAWMPLPTPYEPQESEDKEKA